MSFKHRYQEAADAAATISYVDDDRKRAFMKGVEWLAVYFRNQLAPSAYEGVKGYPKDFLDGLTLDEMRKVLSMLMRAPEEVEKIKELEETNGTR